MTTTPVMTITDEQIAEIEAQCLQCDQKGGAVIMSSDSLSSLISRLRAAEKDAERFRWLCASAWYVGPEPRGDIEAVSWYDKNETLNGVREAIDAAMEQSK